MSSRHLQDISSRRLQDMSSRRLQDVFSVTIFRLPRRLEDFAGNFICISLKYTLPRRQKQVENGMAIS